MVRTGSVVTGGPRRARVAVADQGGPGRAGDPENAVAEHQPY